MARASANGSSYRLRVGLLLLARSVARKPILKGPAVVDVVGSYSSCSSDRSLFRIFHGMDWLGDVLG